MTRRMPADWEAHRATVIISCDAESVYQDDNWIHYIRTDQARLARTIARYDKVLLLVSERNEKLARKTFGNSLDVRVLDHCDMWARDTLTTQVIGENGELIGIDWRFNIWGRPQELQDELGDRINAYEADFGVAQTSAALLGIRSETARIVTEGGAIDSDGEGTILTTESSLLHDGRNPLRQGESEEERRVRIEAELKMRTGSEKIVWLPGSYCKEDYTRGHIDGIARFVAPGHVLLEVRDKEKLTREEGGNLRAVEGKLDAKGRPITVSLIQSPRSERMPLREPERSPEFAGVYINFAFVNGGIVMPKFGDEERDREARRLFEKLYPDRIIEQIVVDDICDAGGGIHCLTQHIPEARHLNAPRGIRGYRTGQLFDLKLTRVELNTFAHAYDAAADARWIAAGKAIRGGEYYRNHVETIVNWKTRGRTTWRLSTNKDCEIEEALRLATAAAAERTAIGVLTGLDGVNVPVASAIMATIKPDRYTVIDFRAFHALGIEKNSFSVSDYLDYLDCCRELVKANDIKPDDGASALRILDRALWQWSVAQRPNASTGDA